MKGAYLQLLFYQLPFSFVSSFFILAVCSSVLFGMGKGEWIYSLGRVALVVGFLFPIVFPLFLIQIFPELCIGNSDVMACIIIPSVVAPIVSILVSLFIYEWLAMFIGIGVAWWTFRRELTGKRKNLW